jgi:hypothetical protein
MKTVLLSLGDQYYMLLNLYLFNHYAFAAFRRNLLNVYIQRQEKLPCFLS